MPAFHSLGDDSNDKTDTPVIGVLAQPWVQAVKDENGVTIDYTQQAFFPFRQYLAASYVKWIEASGARVVPVSFHSTRRELEILFSQLNGLVLPGGDGNYPSQIKMILEIAINENENGHYFPIFGTCLGFQYISTHFAVKNGWKPLPEKKHLSNFNFLDNIPVHNQSNPLTFTDDAKESAWYNDMPVYMRKAIQNEPLTANFHNYGVTVANYKSSLQDDFILVATAMAEVTINEADKNTIDKQEEDEIIPHPTEEGKLIWKRAHITHLEHRRFPIFAVQYHPERTVFEWGVNGSGDQGQNILRSRNAVMASQYTSTFFVFNCRKSPNKFRSLPDMHSKLIYHYPKEAFGVGIVEMYFFNHWVPHSDEETDEANAYVPYLRYINGIRVNNNSCISNSNETGDNKTTSMVYVTIKDDSPSPRMKDEGKNTICDVAKALGNDDVNSPVTTASRRIIQSQSESLIVPM